MPDPVAVSVEQVQAWFQNHIPDGWFTEPVTTVIDREEMLVIGRLAPPEERPGELSDLEATTSYRERTRDERVAIASRAEAMFGRKVSWIVRCGEAEVPFSTLSVPVMTRLRFDERRVLDTLVAAGVARSRSDALGWCVRMVAENEGEWLAKLRDVMTQVAEVRNEGPDRKG